jgi:hypothetical protein
MLQRSLQIRFVHPMHNRTQTMPTSAALQASLRFLATEYCFADTF